MFPPLVEECRDTSVRNNSSLAPAWGQVVLEADLATLDQSGKKLFELGSSRNEMLSIGSLLSFALEDRRSVRAQPRAKTADVLDASL